jgi:hypothetical protein
MSYRYQLTPLSRRRLKIEYLTPFLKDETMKDLKINEPMSHYDLYSDTTTGEILMIRKGGKGQPISTGYKIK